MVDNILSMYITLMPPILAGILNMVWCKSRILKRLAIPLDGNKKFIDEKRIFGDNKTWKGLIGYIVLNVFTVCLWGLICSVSKIEQYNFLYLNHNNTFTYNIMLGILLGLAYSLFELPNSFLKRRLNILPGKTTKGIRKIFFIVLDQSDSVIGCVLVVNCFYNWINEMSTLQLETPSAFKPDRLFPKVGIGYYTFISTNGYIFRDGADGQYIIINKDKEFLITIMSNESNMKYVTEILRDLI